MDFIKEYIIPVCCILIVLIATVFFILVGVMACVNSFAYLNNKSICDVYVDNKQVYNDRCHFINIQSIGENGFTKKLTIYKDIFGFKPIKQYVSENIVVR